MELPKRKQIRLRNFDYSTEGAYFITICTHNKEKLFGGVDSVSVPGQMVAEVFEHVLERYPQVSCPQYVVMPNHFHAILVIQRASAESSATIMDVVQAFKSQSTVEYIRLVKEGKAKPFDKHIWQRSFYDHVIRNDHDFEEIYKYIEENPQKWKLDRFYVNE